jgi:hypothetical protein
MVPVLRSKEFFVLLKKLKLFCHFLFCFLLLQNFMFKKMLQVPKMRCFKFCSKISHSKNKTPLNLDFKLKAFILECLFKLLASISHLTLKKFFGIKFQGFFFFFFFRIVHFDILDVRTRSRDCLKLWVI